MSVLLLLALAALRDPMGAGAGSPEAQYQGCPGHEVLAQADEIAWAPGESRLEAHRALRNSLGAQLPDAPVRIMLYSHGSHLVTATFSLVATRNTTGRWHVNAVGQSQAWVEGSQPWRWADIDRDLSDAEAQALQAVLDDRCLYLGPTFMHDRNVVAGGAVQTLEIDVPGHHWIGAWLGLRTRQTQRLVEIVAGQ